LTDDKDEKKITALGHTGMFRLPYENTIGDLIPTKSSTITYKDGKYENLDYANAIFGFVDNPTSKENNSAIVKAISGRVSFTDLLSEKVEVMEELIPKILSNPKPTTFQHYLDQNGLDQNGKERNHYNSDTKIRGNKLYWHHSKDKLEFIEKEVIIYKDIYNDQIRKISIPQKEILEFVKLYNGEDVSNDNREKIQKKLVEKVINKLGRNTLPKDTKELYKNIKEHFSQYTIIKPIQKASFKGKIYFENLSEEELGCLLFALDLQEGCAHKIGMGKPLGLGSVKITPKLFISNRNNQKEKNGRFFSLQSEWNHIPESKKNIEDYKNIFAKDILKKNSNANWKNLWEHSRLNELKVMLQLNNDLNKEKLRYFEISKLTGEINNNKPDTLNEFKDRKILSQPTKY
jgi:CRISPR-associated protein (TIGR03986 family)